MFDSTRSLLTTDKTRTFLDNWERVVSDKGAIPEWTDIDPSVIARILPDIWLYERLDAENDYLCRLAGDEIIQRWNRKMLRRRFTEFVDPAVSRLMMQNMDTVIRERGLAVGKTPTANDTGWYGERIYAPVTRGDAWCVFGCTAYVARNEVIELRADTMVNRFHLFDAISGAAIREHTY